jgi:hypothetical protein
LRPHARQRWPTAREGPKLSAQVASPRRAQFGSGDAQPVAHRVQVQGDVQLVDLVVRQDVAAGRWSSSGQAAAGKKSTAQPLDGVSWDCGDAKTENGAASVQAGLRDQRFACSTWTSCPARGLARDSAEPVFGYKDKAVASGTRVG